MIFTFQFTALLPGVYVLHDGLGFVINSIEPIPINVCETLGVFSIYTDYGAYDR